MSAVLIALGLVLAFVLGVVTGAGTLFWMFARDETVVRLRPGDVIVKEEVLEKLAKRAKARMQGRAGEKVSQEDDDDGE